MANLKFYKMAQAPVGTQEKPLAAGAVWFNTTNHSIEVWTGSKWEAYSGVLDAVVANEILTITKYDGSTISVDFSIYATDEALGLLDKRVTTLETTVSTHGTNIEGLQTRMTTVEGKAAAAEGQLAGLTEATVMAEIAKQVKVEADRAAEAESDLDERVTPLEESSADYKTRIETLEGKFTGENSVAEQIADAVEAAEDRVDEKLATKADKATYEAYVAANDERVAAVEEAVEAEVLRATGAEDAINAKIGGNYGTGEGQVTVAADVQAAKEAAAAAQKTIDDFLTGEGVDPNKVDALKEIVAYMEEHGEEYQAVVENLNTLNTDVDGLKGQVGTGKVDDRIATAKGEAITAANGYADGLIVTEVERAEAAYEKIGVAAGLVNGLAEGAVAANATAISGLQGQVGTGTVDSRIATAKSEAITAAGAAADQKIADLKLNETYEKVGIAQGLVDGLANGAVKANTDAISALDAKVTEGLSWAVFEE